MLEPVSVLAISHTDNWRALVRPPTTIADIMFCVLSSTVIYTCCLPTHLVRVPKGFTYREERQDRHLERLSAEERENGSAIRLTFPPELRTP